MTPENTRPESAPLRRSRRSAALAAAQAQATDVQPDVMDAGTVEQAAAPADVRPPAAPLTRRQLRDLAAQARRQETPEAVLVVDRPDEAAADAPVVVTADTAAEPVIVTAEPVAEDVFAGAVQSDGQSVLDEFEAAARLFSFTGETPVQVATAAFEEHTSAEEPVAEPQPSRAGRAFRRFGTVRRVTAASATIGAMGVVGLLAVGMTTPAEAVAAASGANGLDAVSIASDVRSVSKDEIQAYVAPATAEVASLNRSDYATATTASLASEVGVTNFSNFFSNNPNAAIQWPFAVGVPITYGYGWRSGAMHEGADFVPGQGAHVQAIAAGTVRIATESGGAFGVTVLIDHIIDGKLVSTRYGHMLYGSLQVKVGETVAAGQYLGRTGNTGRSFGAHTHVEVLENGTTAIDPIAWLRANAGRMSLDG